MSVVNTEPSAFRVVVEVRPPRRPSLVGARRQIERIVSFAHSILIPENPLGVPTVSSLAVAREVLELGCTPVVCLNARDRNLLGLRRDLLTAVATGVNDLLFVQGDPAPDCAPTGLTVRSMVKESRRFAEEYRVGPLNIAVTSRLQALVGWKRDADQLFVQASFSLDALLAWRDSISFEGPVCVGVIVPPSVARAHRWSAELPGVEVPPNWIEALEKDPLAGVELACDLAEAIAESKAFDGIHLIPGIRYREVAEQIESRRRLGT